MCHHDFPVSLCETPSVRFSPFNCDTIQLGENGTAKKWCAKFKCIFMMSNFNWIPRFIRLPNTQRVLLLTNWMEQEKVMQNRNAQYHVFYTVDRSSRGILATCVDISFNRFLISFLLPIHFHFNFRNEDHYMIIWLYSILIIRQNETIFFPIPYGLCSRKSQASQLCIWKNISFLVWVLNAKSMKNCSFISYTDSPTKTRWNVEIFAFGL